MSIVQLQSFDIATAQPWQLLSTSGFWSALPRLARGAPTARLLMIADTLKAEAVEQGFASVAVPDRDLPPGVRAYRMQYDEFLRQAVSEVRYIRLYLVTDVEMDDVNLCNLLGAHGVQARPLDHALPLAFESGCDNWNQVTAKDGHCWALLRSTTKQFGMIFPRGLHRLFALDFPLWAAMQVHTFQERDAVRMLRMKAGEARWMPRKTAEVAQEASEVEGTVNRLRAEMNRAGAALHTLRFYVMVGAETPKALATRMEIVRSSVPLEMERVMPPGETMRRIFSAQVVSDTDGALLTSPGVALLTGSALSYRRRTETRGVLLGIDRNQGPVIVNVFDPDNASYNMVVLGQTGSGKTFATLLIMLRHLLLGTRLILVDPQGNIDLSFLGPEICRKSSLGTGAASVNVLDITHEELGLQVESVTAMLTLLGVLDRQDALARAALDEVLLDIYQPLWGQGEVPAPTLDAVQRRLNLMAGRAQLPVVRETMQLMEYKLGPYTRGSYHDLFGRPTTVDFSLEAPVTVYDVSRLPSQGSGGALRSALLAILVADVNQGIRRRRRAGDATPILFFVDEMGMLMRDGVIAKHVSEEYKTARARRVGMIVADQDLHSLLGPQDESGLHHGAPILANAVFNLLFYQKDSERTRVRESFPGLPEGLFEMLFSLRRGVCLAQVPGDLLLVNVRPSAFERTVLSSQLHDRERAHQVVGRMIAEMFGTEP